ncbi:cytochrome c [Rhizobium sp. AN80A]|uniref:c-type cytochrome n=1 Tax=Rhizobium sp. AN80A TaxID=3040673 RepID=UPI0024B357F0|nr:cytochrome c [Rhizobium sp. AN80A]
MCTTAAWIATSPQGEFLPGDPRLAGPGDIRRGEQIFTAADCSSCHATPGQTDRLHLGGGLALASTFGTFRPPNISADPIDGIGNWDVSDLANALVAGISPTGAHYYPAFPYTSYTSMTPGDIRDLHAYLRTVPWVKGRAPPHHPSLLFAIRRSVGAWKLLFFSKGRSAAPPAKADKLLARGYYLVETLAHCAECHSSRNVVGAIIPETRFAGGIDPQGTGYVPNITAARIADWSEEDLVRMLTTGETPNHGRVGSSMSDVVENTARLPESDREAIAHYIKTLGAIPSPRP